MKTKIIIFLAGSLLLLGASEAAAQRKPMTWGDAPAHLRKLTLTEEEFRSLFSEGDRPYARYRQEIGLPGHCNSSPRSDGRPVLQGSWWLTKDGKIDKVQYAKVCAVLRFDRPAKGRVRKASADLWVTADWYPEPTAGGALNKARFDIIKSGDAKSAADNGRLYANRLHRWIPNLGWGLDYQMLQLWGDSSDRPSQGIARIISIRHGAEIQIDLHRPEGMGADRATAILKGAAALLTRKVFGANASVGPEEEEGQVGILDAYVAAKLGDVPQMDSRSDVVSYGQRFTVAVVYKPSRKELPADKVIIRIDTRPSKEVVEASAKCPYAPERREYKWGYHEVWKNEGEEFLAATRSTKMWGPGTYVMYTTYPTRHNFVYFGGLRCGAYQGQWEIRVRMYEPPSADDPDAAKRPKKGPFYDTHTEVSDTKLSVTIVRPKPASPAAASGGAPAGRAGGSIGGWKD